eukprot:Opistho-2@29515
MTLGVCRVLLQHALECGLCAVNVAVKIAHTRKLIHDRQHSGANFGEHLKHLGALCEDRRGGLGFVLWLRRDKLQIFVDNLEQERRVEAHKVFVADRRVLDRDNLHIDSLAEVCECRLRVAVLLPRKIRTQLTQLRTLSNRRLNFAQKFKLLLSVLNLPINQLTPNDAVECRDAALIELHRSLVRSERRRDVAAKQLLISCLCRVLGTEGHQGARALHQLKGLLEDKGVPSSKATEGPGALEIHAVIFGLKPIKRLNEFPEAFGRLGISSNARQSVQEDHSCGLNILRIDLHDALRDLESLVPVVHRQEHAHLLHECGKKRLIRGNDHVDALEGVAGTPPVH